MDVMKVVQEFDDMYVLFNGLFQFKKYTRIRDIYPDISSPDYSVHKNVSHSLDKHLVFVLNMAL